MCRASMRRGSHRRSDTRGDTVMGMGRGREVCMSTNETCGVAWGRTSCVSSTSSSNLAVCEMGSNPVISNSVGHVGAIVGEMGSTRQMYTY